MKTLALAALVMFGASAAQQDPVYKAGDEGVKSPVVISEKKPSYTAAAMKEKIQGSVEVETVIDTNGRATGVKIIRSLDGEHGLDEKAVEAVKEWRFEPATKDGKAVAFKVKIELIFTLRDKH